MILNFEKLIEKELERATIEQKKLSKVYEKGIPRYEKGEAISINIKRS